jgi:hypothetical protein
MNGWARHETVQTNTHTTTAGSQSCSKKTIVHDLDCWREWLPEFTRIWNRYGERE